MLTILANQLRRVVIAGGYLVATALIVPVFAQSGANIAGNYRGLMTKCLGASQPNICRTALKELVRLADEVDAKRDDWETVEARGDDVAAKGKEAEYGVAVDGLNRRITDFNRDVAGVQKFR
jgi:hypothetical protein